MMRFYRISHNTAYNPRMPQIEEIVEGLEEHGTCPQCGVDRRDPAGDLRVLLGRTRSRRWPDALACGDYPCFVVSDRFLRAMAHCEVRIEPGGKVVLENPAAANLPPGAAPRYFWIDGERHRAGRMDFEASGYVDVQFCPECGTRSDDIEQTYDRRHAEPPPPTIFQYDAHSGLDLFTTDLAPTAFFCTERVLACAREHTLTNLSFCPVEDGILAKPVKYL